MIVKVEKSHTFFIVTLTISMILWGVAWPVNKTLTSYGSIPTILFVRYVLVVLSMIPYLLYCKISFNIKKTGWFQLAITGSLMALYSIVFLKGLHSGMSGAGGVLVTTLNPIFAYCIGLIIQKKLPNRIETIGLSLGIIAGIVLLQVWQNLELLLQSGNLYFLLSAFLWAAMSKFGSKASNHAHSLSFSFWIYVITVFWMCFSLDLCTLNRLVFESKLDFWLLMIYTSVIATTIATSVFFMATTRLGAERASSFIFIVPFMAAISSWIFLDEAIKPHTIIGGVLGVFAVVVLNGNFERFRKKR